MWQRAISAVGGGGELSPNCVYKVIQLTNNTSATTTIDLAKQYILFSALLQDDSSYRAGAVYIKNGVITAINDADISSGYVTPTISGTTLTITATGGATAHRRIMLIQLD